MLGYFKHIFNLLRSQAKHMITLLPLMDLKWRSDWILEAAT